MKRRLECRDGTQSSFLRSFKKKTGLSAMPERRCLAMLISCGDHVLPLSYFESEFTSSLLRIESCSNRMDLTGAQEDTSTWHTMMCKFEELLATLQETGLDEVCTVIEKRMWMLQNIVIHLINWLNGDWRY